jgi:hypothetical protein
MKLSFGQQVFGGNVWHASTQKKSNPSCLPYHAAWKTNDAFFDAKDALGKNRIVTTCAVFRKKSHRSACGWWIWGSWVRVQRSEIFLVAENQSKDENVNRWSKCLLFLVKRNIGTEITKIVPVVYWLEEIKYNSSDTFCGLNGLSMNAAKRCRAMVLQVVDNSWPCPLGDASDCAATRLTTMQS